MENFHLAEREPVALAIAAAAACSTLDELDVAVRAFRGCDDAINEPYVASQRTSHANPIMIVTEKPEPEDKVTGIPFSGDYGRLMREALGHARVAQEDVHIAYALRWAPRDDASPNKTQIATSRPFLFREIELVRPRVIMAQGKGVIDALTMYRGNIMPVLGQAMPFKRGDLDLQAFITFHPAYPYRISQSIPEFFGQVRAFFDRYGRPDAPTGLKLAA